MIPAIFANSQFNVFLRAGLEHLITQNDWPPSTRERAGATFCIAFTWERRTISSVFAWHHRFWMIGQTCMIAPLFGGTLIGIGASLLLYGTGRIFGISGVLGGLFTSRANDRGWRLGVILGLIVAGLILKLQYPAAFPSQSGPNDPLKYILSGFLVGFGTQLGSGCTSGHGICGVSRLSLRSIAATCTFMVTGIITVYVLRIFGGTP
jgi:uncharacterized membrane protein YedE/YeeE